MIMTTEQTQKVIHRKQFVGEVVSTAMKDTVVVAVEDYKKHPKYKKYVKHQKRYKAHDFGNTSNVGDKVIIEETRPISKEKKFKVIGILSGTQAE